MTAKGPNAGIRRPAKTLSRPSSRVMPSAQIKLSLRAAALARLFYRRRKPCTKAPGKSPNRPFQVAGDFLNVKNNDAIPGGSHGPRRPHKSTSTA